MNRRYFVTATTAVTFGLGGCSSPEDGGDEEETDGSGAYGSVDGRVRPSSP
ncbi:MAG: hypothetical protein ABEH58_06365 [Haloplanus sp.]